MIQNTQAVMDVEDLVPELLANLAGREHAVIACTSGKPGAGVTTVTRGLACALARHNLKVLLVDGEVSGAANPSAVRQPSVGEGRNAADSATTAPSPVRVDRLPDGPEHQPVDVLHAVAGEQPDRALHAALLASLSVERQQYDVSIIDAPSLDDSAEVLPMVEVSDVVLLIVRSGRSSAQDVEQASHRLQRHHSKLLGVILNAYRDPVPRWLRRWI